MSFVHKAIATSTVIIDFILSFLSIVVRASITTLAGDSFKARMALLRLFVDH